MICWPGTHIGLIVENLGGGLVRTVEGNSGDAVSVRTRNINDGVCVLIAPQAIRNEQNAPAPRMYYIERVNASPKLLGPWQTAVSRDRAYNKLSPALKKTARKVRTKNNKYALLVGQRRILGPWAGKKARDNALKVLTARGEKVRPYSTSVKSGTADELGKTN